MTNGTFAVNNWMLYTDFTSLELMFQPNVCMFKSQILVLWVNVESPHWRMREWIEGWQIEFWRCWNAINADIAYMQIASNRALTYLNVFACGAESFDIFLYSFWRVWVRGGGGGGGGIIQYSFYGNYEPQVQRSIIVSRRASYEASVQSAQK